jgi:hypothetical protein
LVEEEHEEIYKTHMRPTRRRHFEDEVKVTFAEHPQIAQTTSETDLESDYPSELASSENDSIKTTEAESTPLLKVHSEIGELEIPAIHHI